MQSKSGKIPGNRETDGNMEPTVYVQWYCYRNVLYLLRQETILVPVWYRIAKNRQRQSFIFDLGLYE